jgi:hypothetical protein
MAKHINEQNGEIKEMFTAYSLFLTINEHSMEVNRATDECRREYEILVDAVVNSQKSVIKPQLITPALILERVKLAKPICQVIFLYLSPQVPLVGIGKNVVFRIISIDVFFKGSLPCISNSPTPNKQRVLQFVSCFTPSN